MSSGESSADTPDCHFFLTSECKRGSACEFRHNDAVRADVRAGNAQPCVFYERGKCSRGADCRFLHSSAASSSNSSSVHRSHRATRNIFEREEPATQEAGATTITHEDGTTSSNASTVCHFFLKGHCRNGASCPFTHPTHTDERNNTQAPALTLVTGDNVENGNHGGRPRDSKGPLPSSSFDYAVAMPNASAASMNPHQNSHTIPHPALPTGPIAPPHQYGYGPHPGAYQVPSLPQDRQWTNGPFNSHAMHQPTVMFPPQQSSMTSPPYFGQINPHGHVPPHTQPPTMLPAIAYATQNGQAVTSQPKQIQQQHITKRKAVGEGKKPEKSANDGSKGKTTETSDSAKNGDGTDSSVTKQPLHTLLPLEIRPTLQASDTTKLNTVQQENEKERTPLITASRKRARAVEEKSTDVLTTEKQTDSAARESKARGESNTTQAFPINQQETADVNRPIHLAQPESTPAYAQEEAKRLARKNRFGKGAGAENTESTDGSSPQEKPTVALSSNRPLLSQSTLSQNEKITKNDTSNVKKDVNVIAAASDILNRRKAPPTAPKVIQSVPNKQVAAPVINDTTSTNVTRSEDLSPEERKRRALEKANRLRAQQQQTQQPKVVPQQQGTQQQPILPTEPKPTNDLQTVKAIPDKPTAMISKPSDTLITNTEENTMSNPTSLGQRVKQPDTNTSKAVEPTTPKPNTPSDTTISVPTVKSTKEENTKADNSSTYVSQLEKQPTQTASSVRNSESTKQPNVLFSISTAAAGTPTRLPQSAHINITAPTSERPTGTATVNDATITRGQAANRYGNEIEDVLNSVIADDDEDEDDDLDFEAEAARLAAAQRSLNR